MMATRMAASMTAPRGAAAQRPGLACTNTSSTAVTGTLQVNGQTATTVSFPPTGSTRGTVSVQVHVTKGSTNSLTVTGGPALGTLTVGPVPAADGTLLAGKQSGRCADIHDNTVTDGTQAELWDCDGGDNQKWSGT